MSEHTTPNPGAHAPGPPAPARPARPRLDLSAVMEAAARDDCTGFCLACGHEQCGCEPDARRYQCEACGERKVYGAEEILLMSL